MLIVFQGLLFQFLYLIKCWSTIFLKLTCFAGFIIPVSVFDQVLKYNLLRLNEVTEDDILTVNIPKDVLMIIEEQIKALANGDRMQFHV